MRKSVAVLFGLVCMAYIAGCGDSSSTSTATNYDVTTPVPAAAAPGTILGGSIQGGAPVFHDYSVSIFAGSSAGFNNISSAGSATFNRPIAVTTDGAYLYVADYVNNAIRRINIATKHVMTIAGNSAGLAGSTDGTGSAASFNLPRDITTDGTSLYVADSGNYTIRKIDFPAGPEGTAVVTTIAGAVGVSGSLDSPNTGSNARFNVLNGITTDGKNLYVTDSNNTIRKIVLPSPGTVSSGPVTTVAGAPGTTGTADGLQSAARFNLPSHITTDGPNLYVTDFSSSTIRKIELITGAVTTIAGKAEPGGAAGSHADSTDGTGQSARFNQPNGITCDGSNLYVTDSYDNTIRKIVLSPGTVYSGPVTTIAGGAAGPAGGLTDGVGIAANFNFPIGITTDGTSLFITDSQNHRIRQIQ